MIRPVREYADPLDVLLRAEEQTCKGCRWRRVVERALQCTHPRTADPDTNTRCDEYEERE